MNLEELLAQIRALPDADSDRCGLGATPLQHGGNNEP
nr:MAG TPA_asm: hypothetical protein [Caudoviricetes sp.]